jgi:hypothetical protein
MVSLGTPENNDTVAGYESDRLLGGKSIYAFKGKNTWPGG